nr:histone acetyltransferase KAT6B-like [Lytechinus pictus]
MAEIDRQTVILDAIDSLRRRKARPDFERIFHMVERKYGLTGADVITELNRMVDNDIVIKVEYKGSISYRNAANWCKNRLSGYPLNSHEATRSILQAIEKLTCPESIPEQDRVLEDANYSTPNEESHIKRDGPLEGASLEQIVKFFADGNPDTKFTRNYLEEALAREVTARRLYFNTTNKYVLAKYAVSCEEETSFQNPQLKRGPRPSKRKRIKKTHGPDFEHEPLTKTSIWDQKCDYCTLPANCNKYGEKEQLLVCKDCTLKVHPSCMKYSRQLAERSRLSPWQCIDCKTCHVCNDAGDADTLLFCDSCDKGYHMACHNPKVEEKPVGKWVCELCASEDMEIGSNFTDEGSVISSSGSTGSKIEDKLDSGENGSSKPSGLVTPDVATPNQSRVANLPIQSAQADPSSIPSATPGTNVPKHPAKWSLDDVVKLMQERGFKEQAETFRDQEIDGHALLLLRRADVLTGLSFKLGPALKIYEIISKLQLSHTKHSSPNAKTKSSLQSTSSKTLPSSSSQSSIKNKPSKRNPSMKTPSSTRGPSPTAKSSPPPRKPTEAGKKQSPPTTVTHLKVTSPNMESPPAKTTPESGTDQPPQISPLPVSDKSTPTSSSSPPNPEVKSPRKSGASPRTTP